MRVTYMNGAGNDFMVLDARENENLDFAALAVKYCAVTGADGFMAVGKSEIADFRLHFYNSDGTRGEMCGNGARCICRYAYDHGIAPAEMTVQTDAGLVPGWRIDENQYRVKLNNPGVLDLNRKGDVAYVELGDPGVPHAVREYHGDLHGNGDALREELRALRFDPAFPKSANVNYYQIIGGDEVKLLTFERGVEDFTLACGTGTGSTAAVMYLRGQMTGTVLTAHNPGGTLKITLDATGNTVGSILLEGPTEVVREYEL